MFISGFFVARVPDATRPEYAFVSSVFVVLFAIPSYLGLWRWIGASRAIKVLLFLGLFAIGIESIAILTGWPYGEFDYGNKIGGKVFGLVPWTVPFAWTPLVLGCFALVQRLFLGRSKYFMIAAVAVALMVCDLVLDPGAVNQEFWSFPNGGFYYGVPLSNFGGWLLSGAIGCVLLMACLPSPPTRAPRGMMSSLFLTLAFWTSVCTWTPLPVAAIIGWLLLIGLVYWIFLAPLDIDANEENGNASANLVSSRSFL